MDFSHPEVINDVAVGTYQKLRWDRQLRLYIAFNSSESEPTEVLHGDLRSRMESGDEATLAAMQEIADLPIAGRTALESQDVEQLSRLINRNFDLRQSICDLNPYHVKMIEIARSVGASSKYCGSGGAIVGLYEDNAMYDSLTEALNAIGCTVIRPTVAEPWN